MDKYWYVRKIKCKNEISDFHIRNGWPLAFPNQTGEMHKVPEVVVKIKIFKIYYQLIVIK